MISVCSVHSYGILENQGGVVGMFRSGLDKRVARW